MRNRLILFEGIPGSGKSTTSRLLCEELAGRGIPTELYPEADEHPIDLPYHAYLAVGEYGALREEYPRHRAYFDDTAIIREGYVLVPYKLASTPRDESLIVRLSAREFCYSDVPAVPFEVFCAVFRRRYADFVARVREGDRVVIFESTLLQHQLHDINRLYPEVPDEEILRRIHALADILSPLCPILFYISQRDIAEALTRTALLRGKPRYAWPETIAYYERRKRLELAALEGLPFEARVLDNTACAWDELFGEVLRALNFS